MKLETLRGCLVAFLEGLRRGEEGGAVDCGWGAGVAEEVGTTKGTGVVNERVHLDASLVLAEAFGGQVGRVAGLVVSTGGGTGDGGGG